MRPDEILDGHPCRRNGLDAGSSPYAVLMWMEGVSQIEMAVPNTVVFSLVRESRSRVARYLSEMTVPTGRPKLIAFEFLPKTLFCSSEIKDRMEPTMELFHIAACLERKDQTATGRLRQARFGKP